VGEVDGWWWLSTKRMTFAVLILDDVIVETAPIARKFVGQPPAALSRWLQKQGRIWARRLDDSGR
jgi:hypothetical protein